MCGLQLWTNQPLQICLYPKIFGFKVFQIRYRGANVQLHWLTAKLWSELSFNMCPVFIHMKHNLWTSRSSTWGNDLNCKILNNVPYTRVLHSLTSQFIFQLGDNLNAWYSALSLVLMEAQNNHKWPNPHVQLQKL